MNQLTPPHRQETPPPDPSYRLESAGRNLPTREDVKKQQTARRVIKNWLVKTNKRKSKHGGKKTKQKSRKSRKSRKSK